MIHIVLVEPQIPQNTGNIARTCACTGCALHIVKPMGFTVTDAKLKRAGLDYWPLLDLTYYENLDDFFSRHKGGEFYYLSTKATQCYADVPYPRDCFLLFGKETKGLPESLIFKNPERALRIPMGENLRSLNLSNAVAVVLYEALRRGGFQDLK